MSSLDQSLPQGDPGIPVRDRQRGTIIGFCSLLPPESRIIVLEICRSLETVTAGDADDLLTPPEYEHAELVYGRGELADGRTVVGYWTTDYACLAHACVTPY